MVLPYMVCHGSHQYTPFMLAYIPAPWILWVMTHMPSRFLERVQHGAPIDLGGSTLGA